MRFVEIARANLIYPSSARKRKFKSSRKFAEETRLIVILVDSRSIENPVAEIALEWDVAFVSPRDVRVSVFYATHARRCRNDCSGCRKLIPRSVWFHWIKSNWWGMCKEAGDFILNKYLLNFGLPTLGNSRILMVLTHVSTNDTSTPFFCYCFLYLSWNI